MVRANYCDIFFFFFFLYNLNLFIKLRTYLGTKSFHPSECGQQPPPTVHPVSLLLKAH